MRKYYNLKAYSVLAASAVLIVAFQNCGQKMGFETSAVDSKNLIASVEASCIDDKSVEHLSGEKWSVETPSINKISCSDAADTEQGFLNTDTFLCQAGSISKIKSATTLTAPMSSCPAPSLTVAADNANPTSGSPVNLNVASAAVHNVSYTCSSVATSMPVKSGALAVGTVAVPLGNVTEDLACDVTAIPGDMDALKKSVAITLDCESSGKLKDPATHQCVEFQCKQFMAITPAADGSFDIPARTTAGICYSVKLMDAIPNGPSSLTATVDDDFISRNHDNGYSDYKVTRKPYVMGKSVFDFIMRAGGGARQVKLSGSGVKNDSIRIDNYVAVGLAKRKDGLSHASYNAYGSHDSTVDAAETYVLKNNSPVPLKSFATGGTSTFDALDITTLVSTEAYYSIDVRALDCGGSRFLTDIYMIFQ